ncbi:MAG: DUF1815 family protein [Prochlorococcaceae cyanobacterium]
MFPRLAEQFRSVVRDLVMSLQALSCSLQQQGLVASCYVCGDGRDGHGASFVADLGDGHMVRFLVSDFGISWVESRHGRELVKLEGAEAIQELQRIASQLQPDQTATAKAAVNTGNRAVSSRQSRPQKT